MNALSVTGKKTSRGSMRASKRFDNIYGLFTASIPAIGFIIFGLIPLVTSIIIAFSDPTGYSLENMGFVGFDNFAFVLQDELFWKSLGNTFLNCLVTPLSMIVGLFIAIVLNNTDLKGRTVYKSIFFIPYVCSVVATSIMWKSLLDANYGLINQLLGLFGIPGQDWIGDPNLVMPTMIFLGVWSGMGYSIILYSAALTSLNSQLIEAAEIDGANSLQRFFHVVLPALAPTTFFLLITGIIGNLQDFARFQVMLGQGGGPNSAGLTVVFYLYEKGWKDIITYGMGIANATSWLLTMVILVVTIFQFAVNKNQGDMTK